MIYMVPKPLLSLLVDGIGPQRISTEGTACLKVFFLYPKGILVNKQTNPAEKVVSLVELKPVAAQYSCGIHICYKHLQLFSYNVQTHFL